MAAAFGLGSGATQARAGGAADPTSIDSPQAGISKPGFIDNDNGANIRTGPRELDGKALSARPLPPATRVFVSGQHPQTSQW